MDMTNKEYGEYVNGKSKPSPILKNLIWAFVIGGLICTVGQGLLNLYKKAGLTAEDAGSAVSMTLIFAAALLTGLGLFDKLAKRAGAGTLVPITGFANAVASPAYVYLDTTRGVHHRHRGQAVHRGGAGPGVWDQRVDSLWDSSGPLFQRLKGGEVPSLHKFLEFLTNRA